MNRKIRVNPVSKAAFSTHLMQSYSVGAGPLLVSTVSELALLAKSMLSGGWEDGREGDEVLLPYAIDGDTASIRVRGTLIAGAGLFPWSRLVDTQILFRTIRHLRLSSYVKVLKVYADSPGGVSHWVKETAGEIDRFNKTPGKRVEAYVDRCACSAMYWIVAPAKTITINSSAALGSVGVRITLMNQQRWYEEFLGEKYIDIVSGEFKASGTDTREPTERETARFQEKVGTMATDFITAVAGYRSLTESEVRGWEADTFIGAEAVSKGLADSVAVEGVDMSTSRPRRSYQGFTTANHQMRGTPMSLLDELKAKHSDLDPLAVESLYHEVKASLEKAQADALAVVTTERDTLKTSIGAITEELSGAKATLTSMANAFVEATWEATFAEGGSGAMIPDGSMRTALKGIVTPKAHMGESGVLDLISFTQAVNSEAKEWAAAVAVVGKQGVENSETPAGGGSSTRSTGASTGGGGEGGYSAEELAGLGL